MTNNSLSSSNLSESVTSISPYRQFWALDPAITFLNHGSFGACPIPVLEKQSQLRSQLEAEPVRFFALELEALLDQARQCLAEFVGANAADLAFVPNATTGVNTVLRSLSLQAGDELLITNHEYNASRNALNWAAELTGATVVVAKVPFPLATSDQIVERVLDKISTKTKLVVLDHVTSQTGLIFPLRVLVQELSKRGIEVLVDGAHAPGMLSLNLKELGVAYYTGNCHKWLCSPKGAAFLYIREDLRSRVRPLVISHGANSPRCDRSFFHLEFDWMGTADPTPYLCVPTAIEFMGSLLPEGWTGLMRHNRTTVLAARRQLCQALNVLPPCPEAMIGSMAVIPLPDGSVELLKDQLFQQFQIEVPVIPWIDPCNRLLRISAQIYNTPTDYDVLARALLQLLAAEPKNIEAYE
ncbi:MAG: aminotransferase class V-fold PLP-dependent enzyme [Elainellaceae cyanobacterium]